MRTKPYEYRFRIGKNHDVLITSGFRSIHTWRKVQPALTIIRYAHEKDVIGETVHFSQAKAISTLKRRLLSYADSIPAVVIKLPGNSLKL